PSPTPNRLSPPCPLHRPLVADDRRNDIFSDTICGKLQAGGCMRAARCEQYGGPENVVIRDIPSPEVIPGHVLVDVAAAAVNYPDLLFIANSYQVPAPLPFTPGSEFAGRVAAVGEGVTGVP